MIRILRPVVGGALENLFESFVKNVICDHVEPCVGSVVKVDLMGGMVDHSGIYVGDGMIVEVTNIDGAAAVRRVSTEEFINGPGGFFRTGAYIYVACKKDRDGKCVPMGAQDIADRANAAVDQVSSYDLVTNNCHLFTEYCVTGEEPVPPGILFSIENALRRRFVRHDYENMQDVWRSTGISL